MKYLKKFETHPEYTEFIETEEFIKPNVSCCSNETVLSKERELHYNKYYVDYLKFTALESGTITLNIAAAVTTTDLSYIEYSIDGINWVHTDNSSSNITITTPTLEEGDIVLWRGSGQRMSHNTSTLSSRSTFSSTCQCNVSGDIRSLLNPKPENASLSNYAYRGLFYQMTKLVDASDLIIAKTQTYGCDRMFYGCTALTKAPKILDADVSSNSYCYSYMFYGCTSLTSAPQLPQTTLASGTNGKYCYQYMFYNCTSLTTAPALPATILSEGCYQYMFYGCSSLTTVPSVLPAENLEIYCYYYMFYGCTSLVVAPNLCGTKLATYCCAYMFYNCVALTTPPSLPAVNLEQYCYHYMFYGCSSITSAPILPARELKTSCYYCMFDGCSSLNYVKALFLTDISQTTAYTSDWLSGVAATGNFIKNPLATWERADKSGIPIGWTVQNDMSLITEYNP